MECRTGCGACCIAPLISSPIPGMPKGKPSGVRCIQLNEENACRLFGLPERPPVCLQFQPDEVICGHNAVEALDNLIHLEMLTG